jgi:glycosyltransferase involved in cell wall biosynthesis
MSPSISVIIPSFKPDKYIEQCLTSLAVQTIPKDSFEVIVILNGCDEPWKSNLSQLLDSLHSKYDLCGILLHSDWGNVSNARNMGLDRAKGEYICFIDDDDYVSPSFLEKLLSKANEKTVALCHPVAFRDNDNNIVRYVNTDEYLRCKPGGLQRFYKAKKFFQGPWMKLIHRDIIGNRQFDTRFTNGEDSMFMFLISDRIKWVDFTDDDAIYYRRIRNDGAHYSLNGRKRCKSAWNKLRMFTKYYFSAPWRYNLWFYITRLMACVKTAINI